MYMYMTLSVHYITSALFAIADVMSSSTQSVYLGGKLTRPVRDSTLRLHLYLTLPR